MVNIMYKVVLSLLFITLFFNFSYAQVESVSTEESVFQDIEPLSVIDLNQSEETSSVKLDRSKLALNLRSDHNIIARYDNFPKKVFTKQQFTIALNATIATDSFDEILTTFEGGNGYEIINPDSKWVLNSKRTFQNKFIVKVKNENFVMPDIIVSLVQDMAIVEEYQIEKPEIKVSKVGQQIEHFSSVIAKELTLTSHITKQYDNNTVLTIIELEGIESNLKDFKLKNYQKQGIESLSGDFDREKLVYFIILPIHEETLTFSYYNTQSSKIEIISSPIVHSEEIVSTQTDLNPHNSNVLLYKRVGIGVLLVICILWLLFRRDKISLLVTIICALYLVYVYLPNRNFLLQKDTNVFILPTKSSSVFFKTDSDVYVEVLDSQKGYIKVLLPDDKIGWVNEEDISKN
jgi:hypothetical protein